MARATPEDGAAAQDAGPEGLASHPAHRDPGLAFVRVAPAVRLTIALQSRLMKDLAALDRTQADARRKRIHRLVERAIEAERDDADDVDELSDEAWERLTDEEDVFDLAARPVGETVVRICKALGLSPDWGAQEIWAADEIWGAHEIGGAHGIGGGWIGAGAAGPPRA